MLPNYIVTIVTVFALIFGLFSSEIKENYTTSFNPQLYPGIYHPKDKLASDNTYTYSSSGPRTIGLLHSKDGLAPGGKFTSPAGQSTTVGGSPLYRYYNDKKYNLDFKRQLGYQNDQAFPPMAENENEICFPKEYYSSGEQCLKTGVDAGRNIQTAPPPKFMVTGPKLGLYKPTDPDVMGVNPQKPIDHAEDLVVSQFGQVQMDARKSNAQSIQENYDNYATASVDLPKDMCSVNMLGAESQPVIYDRVMYSNIRSRNRGQGDYIRGDLMIAPDNYKPGGGGHPQWFQVSAKPERDLNPGCMEFLFGRNEELALGLAEADIDVASFGL